MVTQASESHQGDAKDMGERCYDAGCDAPLEGHRHDAVHDEDYEHKVPDHGINIHL